MKTRPIATLFLATSMFLPAALASEDSAAMVAATSQAAIDAGNPPSWWKPELPEKVAADVQRKGMQLAGGLKLDDEAKTAKVAALVSEHFGRVWAWHQEVDEKLDAAWKNWDAARDNTGGKEKDELKALTVMTEQIDPIYAEFSPQIRGFLKALRAEVGNDSTNRIIDQYTRSPGAKRTFDAYVAMVPEMTDEEKAIMWGRMERAREDSMAAWSDERIIKIFKKYKVRNEFSLDYFGYGYRKRYQQWVDSKK